MKPFLHGRKAAESKPLPPPPERPSALPSRDQAAVPTKVAVGPNVEIVRQGGKVTHLIFTCTCGEKIEVECLYPEDK